MSQVNLGSGSENGSPEDLSLVACVVCEARMDSPEYLIRPLPGLPSLPVCVVCEEEYEGQRTLEDDQCGICCKLESEAGSDFVMCGGHDSECLKTYCRDCIKKCTSSEYLEEVDFMKYGRALVAWEMTSERGALAR